MINYAERCEQASKAQRIDEIVSALKELGIHATSEQTGGFTMCAYIELPQDHYIYANTYGASEYDENDYFGDIVQYDEPQEAKIIAQEIFTFINK